jgi:Peptidase family M28
METDFAERIVKKLASFPNRAVASIFEQETILYLSSLFASKIVLRESFKSPKNYLIIVGWLLLGIIVSIVLLHIYPIIGLILSLGFVAMALLYFNWYASPIIHFPPLVTTHNLLIKETTQKPRKVILMAHYDTAPISVLYLPSMVGNFRNSLKINILIMVVTQMAAIFYYINPIKIVSYLLIALAIYFLLQLVIASFDFFKFGYSNGASDNATGVAAAAETARILWDKNLKNTEIQLLFTGAEEVGMIGAKVFLNKHFKEFDKNTLVINFDTLGTGSLKVINKTGSWADINYDNELVKIAKNIITTDTGLNHVKTGAWHTADFDSVWFNRVGIQTVTLAALDNNGRMPNIHRETDVLKNVDFKPMHDAINLATKMILEADKLPMLI